MRLETVAKSAGILFLLSVAISWPGGLIPPIIQTHGASRTLALVGNAFSGWNGSIPGPTITVSNRDTVTISLTANDGSTHAFYVDVNGNGVADCPSEKCSQDFNPASPISHSFNVDFGPGTFAYICPFHPSNMQGAFVVQGFTITTNPSSLTIPRGSSRTSTITVSSVASFAGDVSLSANISPSGPTALFSPATVSVPASGTASSTLTISTTGSTAPGTYSVDVVGTNGTSTASTTVTFTVVVPDFTITSSLTSLSLDQGRSSTATLTLASQASFSGTVTLTITTSISGPTVSLNATSVSLAAGDSKLVVLTVTALSGGNTTLPPGNYMITVTGTSGSDSHSVNISLTVNSPAPPQGGIDYVPVVTGLAGVIAVVVLAVYFVRRRSPQRPPNP